MIRGWLLILFVATPLFAAQPKPKEKPPTLERVNTELLARGALLIDPLTGEVLYAKNVDEAFPPASTVKMMTALVAYEKTGGLGTITIQPEDTRVEPSHVRPL